MAITFDAVNKIIQLDRYSVSVNELWTAYVQWSLLSDNIKYGELMSQIGGTPPIALYVYLELGWKVRPMEANGITKITGNLLTRDNSSPIASTVGNWNVLVNMETPVQAVAIATTQASVDVTALETYIDNNVTSKLDSIILDLANSSSVPTTTASDNIFGYVKIVL